MKQTFFIIVTILIFSINSYCQLIDVLQAHVGTAIFPNDLTTDREGRLTNIYSNYNPGQVIGISATKFITDKLQLGVGIEFMRTQKKESYTMNVTKTSLIVKYNILAPDVYRFSPYLIANGNYLFVNMTQQEFTFNRKPENTENTVVIERVEAREGSRNYFAPVFGGSIGAGLDFNFYDRYSIFAEGSYNIALVKNSVLQDKSNNYTLGNKADLVYTNIIAGIRIYMY